MLDLSGSNIRYTSDWDHSAVWDIRCRVEKKTATLIWPPSTISDNTGSKIIDKIIVIVVIVGVVSATVAVDVVVVVTAVGPISTSLSPEHLSNIIPTNHVSSIFS